MSAVSLLDPWPPSGWPPYTCHLEDHDPALVVDGQVELEAKESAHGGAAPLDQPLEHPVSPDPYSVTDHQLGAIGRVDRFSGHGNHGAGGKRGCRRRGARAPIRSALGRPAKQWRNSCSRPWRQKCLKPSLGKLGRIIKAAEQRHGRIVPEGASRTLHPRLSPHGGAHAVAVTPFSGDGPGPTLPVLQSGKERLDCVTLASQPLAVMDWFLVAATGRDALLDQHLTDFVPVLPLIPHHCGGRRQAAVLAQHISTSEVAAWPLTQVESQGITFAVADPMERAAHAPLGTTNQAGAPPLLRLEAVGWAFVSPAAAIVVEGFLGIMDSRGIHPASPFRTTRRMPLNTVLSSTRFPPRYLGKQGADAINLLRAEPQQPGHHPSPPGTLLGVPLC